MEGCAGGAHRGGHAGGLRGELRHVFGAKEPLRAQANHRARCEQPG